MLREMNVDEECGPSNEMSTGCRWGGKEPRTGVGRQRVVWGGSGLLKLGALSGLFCRVHWFSGFWFNFTLYSSFLLVIFRVRNGDGSRDRLWGWRFTGAYPRLMRSLVIDLNRLNTSNESQKKKKTWMRKPDLHG